MNKTSTYIGIIGIVLIVASIIYTYKYAPIKPANYDNDSYGQYASSTDDGMDDTYVAGSNDASLATYIDPAEVFAFEYPKEFTVQGGSVSNTNEWREFSTPGELGRVRAVVNIPRSFQPNTNFSDAKFQVGLGANTAATDKCLTVRSVQGGSYSENPVSEKVTIHGVTFTKFKFGDAAAGNYYDTTSYHAIHNGQCIVLEYRIHSTNLGSYDPNQGIKAFDEPKIQNILEDMVRSFKLLDVIGSAPVNSDQGIDKGISRQITVDGKFTCLPHRNTSGPQTMECAFGIKETNTGDNYALNLEALSESDKTLVSSGANIRVSGLMVPAEALSSDNWQKYNMEGIISVKTVSRI